MEAKVREEGMQQQGHLLDNIFKVKIMVPHGNCNYYEIFAKQMFFKKMKILEVQRFRCR